jgi:hypothetical protein
LFSLAERVAMAGPNESALFLGKKEVFWKNKHANSTKDGESETQYVLKVEKRREPR